MSDLNQCTFTGRLGKDPETTNFASGDSVCNFSLAVGKKWKKDGEVREKTTWVNVKAFGKLGEVMTQYLSKGDQVCIVGELDIRKYEKKDGTTGYSTEIIAHHLTMLGGKKDGAAPRESRSENRAPAADDGFPDDSIPF